VNVAAATFTESHAGDAGDRKVISTWIVSMSHRQIFMMRIRKSVMM
jgi:hypothetical protein